VGYFKLFSTSGNARANVSLKALAIFPTALSDSLVAKLGTP
jgi:hypothetical protein